MRGFWRSAQVVRKRHSRKSSGCLLPEWDLTARIDPITDENTSFIGVFASDYPSLARYSALVLRCTSDPYESSGVEIYFAADRYLGIEDYYSVTYRVEKSEPVSSRWSAATNNEAAFLPTSRHADFLSAINKGSELVVRISGYSQDYTYVLPLNGFNDALYALGCYKGPAL